MRRRTGRSGGWCAMMLMGAVMLAGAPPSRAQEDGGGQEARPSLPAGSQMVRGTVTASAADGLTVKTEAGESYKVSVTPNTRMMKARQPVKLEEIKAGDGLGAMGVMDASTKTLHAVFLTVVDAEQVKKAQADLGKTYIAGEVTAIDELKLTIKRMDGVSQVIAVDEGTSFRKGGRGMGMMGGGGGAGAGAGAGAGDAPRAARQGEGAGGAGGGGGESITLADVKVGDSVMGRGALKSGVFVPTELRVIDRSARGRRRNGGAGAPPEGAGTAAPGTPGAPGGGPQ